MTLYKQFEDGTWLKADQEVFLPDGRVVTQENQIDGWVWHDEPPQEYTDWVNSQVPPNLSEINIIPV